MYFVKYTSHTRDIVASLAIKSIREQLVTRMVRCGGEIENGDFDKGKNMNVGFFLYVFVVTI